MSGARELAEHVLDQLRPLGDVTLRRYFGGWALRRHGRQFAMVMDTLYLRGDGSSRSGWQARGSRPFTYRSGGRMVTVGRYLSVPDDLLDDPESLCALVREVTEPTRPSP